MKKVSIPFIFAMCLLCSGCASTRQGKGQDETAAPKWITDQGRLEVFPDKEYVSNLSYGSTPQESKEKAGAAISEYIKSSVVSSASVSYFYKESEIGFTENKKLRQDVQVSTANNLYQLEYTNPYYNEERGQFACVAYINRERAFNFVRPKLEIAKNQFPQAYRTTLKKESLLDKIIGIKRSQSVLPDFYEVYDFARAILPEKAAVYEETDSLASESILKQKELASSVLIKIQGTGDIALLESSGVIAELSNQFKKLGFVVGNSQKANCIALVEVKAMIAERGDVSETYPELYIKITEHGTEKISYASQLSKVAATNRDTLMSRIRLALVKGVSTSFVNECF